MQHRHVFSQPGNITIIIPWSDLDKPYPSLTVNAKIYGRFSPFFMSAI